MNDLSQYVLIGAGAGLLALLVRWAFWRLWWSRKAKPPALVKRFRVFAELRSGREIILVSTDDPVLARTTLENTPVPPGASVRLYDKGKLRGTRKM